MEHITMNDSDLLTLYTSFKDDARGWLALHRQHFTQFVAIILAVLAATVAALVKLRGEGSVLITLTIGPALSAYMSVMAIFVCDKFYKRYAEHDAISYKFYRLIETNSGLKEDLDSVAHVYPNQKQIFPDRWDSRLNRTGSVDEYATSRLRASDASNLFIVRTFKGLIGVSIILMLVILIVAVL